MLAYICQLLIQTPHGVKHEVRLASEPAEVEKEIRRVLKGIASLRDESDAAPM